MKNRVYFIYKYTFPNGKVYIGQTYKGSGRYGKPMKYRNSLVGNAMSKYPSFQKEIIEYCSKEMIDEREVFYINKYDSTNRNKGYNRDYGGSKNKRFTNELKKQLSKIHTDLQVSEIEQFTLDGSFVKTWKSIKEASRELKIDRGRISKALHGHIKQAGGYIWKLKEVYSPYNSRPISQYDLKGNFIRDWDNTKQAEEALHIHNILNSLNGHNKTTGGFQWKYKGSSKTIEEYKQNRVYIGRHVFQYDLEGNFIKEWKSYVEASKELNIPQQHISRVLKGERRMTRGFIFKYEKYDSIEKLNTEEKSFAKKIEQYSLDGSFIKEWSSITSAEESLGIKNGIGKCCRGKAKTAGGYQWKYKDDNRVINSLIKEKPKKIKKPRPLPSNAKSIIQISDNETRIFNSMAEASRETGINISCISDCLKKRQKTAGGYRWEYFNK